MRDPEKSKCACDGSPGTRGEREEWACRKAPLQFKVANDRPAGGVSPSSTRKTLRHT